MRNLYLALILALPLAGQQLHLYDPNVPYFVGAPPVLATCSGTPPNGGISGLSNAPTPVGTSIVMPISVPLVIYRGTVDIWLAPSANGNYYTVNLTCSDGAARQQPSETWVV